jgi:predicted HicB family RNase H-like nuclease
MNTLTYEGYHARIGFDGEDGIFAGRIAGTGDIAGFHGAGVDELKAASRIHPETHRRAAIAAELSGKSLYNRAEEVLEKAAGDT